MKKCELLNGDCLKLMESIEDESIECVITDPPYASTDCAWDRPFDLDAWWKQINRVTSDSSVVVVFAAQPFTTAVISANRKHFRYDIVWDKLQPVGFLNANRQPLRIHETILVFSRRPSLTTYKPQFSPGIPYRSAPKSIKTQIYRKHKAVATINPGRRHPTSILRFAKPRGAERRHPTQKPFALLQWIVRSYTRPRHTILDPFMGSGTTIEAALFEGRGCIGIERDPTIFRSTVDHLSNRFRGLVFFGRRSP